MLKHFAKNCLILKSMIHYKCGNIHIFTSSVFCNLSFICKILAHISYVDYAKTLYDNPKSIQKPHHVLWAMLCQAIGYSYI